MTFDESRVKRDDMGRFSENWAARLAEQMTAAVRRSGESSRHLPPVDAWMGRVNDQIEKGARRG